MDQLAFEGGKLLSQLGGTALIAWLAVRWAVSKFKQEKKWEQKLQIYSRILAALREMQFVNDQWVIEAYRDFERDPQEALALQSRYRDAKRDLDQCIAMSRLVLSDSTYQTLARLRDEIENFRDEDAFLTYDGVSVLLKRAQDEISELGRAALR
ncbi:hypothetical protein [Erythrobacter sp. EC-HK427]|uniref:hypothetical protein n=1 Tax=Erythrobacter sp. EC-HK427 TaxID=2038396 RepID=UPI00125C5EC8|nr:hypothetical protein [Erythrobacter sp. EC-HK427]VVT18073.1 conserved hypothetical protein [Erythrobacter sp. EC-HK427]